MKKQLVYDMPTRVFHWLFAGLFIFSFAIAKVLDDDSPGFSYHMLAGFLLAFIVTLRVVWGIFGTKHSRFSSFALHPKDLAQYFTGILSGEKRRWTGHNPASSWAALTMFGLTLGLGITGYLMANGQKEVFEDIHELLANGFLIVALMHVAGVILHTLRHQDGIALSMIHGSKQDIETSQTIPSSKSGIAILFLVLTLSFAMYLNKNYDKEKQALDLFGTVLQLGESDDDHHD